ncbi:MAG: hypothetical protein R2729_30900 [Bryobacteraceae bacterium]
MPPRARLYGQAAAFVFLGALAAWGTAHSGIFSHPVWSDTGWRRFLIFTTGFAVWSAGWIAARPAWLAPATAMAAAAWVMATGGVFAIVVVAGLLAAWRTAGRFIAHGFVVSTLVGAAVWMLTIHFLAGLRFSAGIALAMIAMTVPGWPGLAADLRALPRLDRRGALLWTPALFAAACQLLAAWKPEVGVDALSMHLTIPAYVGEHGWWPFDVQRFLFSVMPMGANWLFTAAHVTGGEMAVRLLNFGAFVAVLALLRSPAACALYASMPLVQLTTGSVFVENTQVAFAVGTVAAFEAGAMMPAAILAGAAMMIKLSSIVFVAPLAAIALWRYRGEPKRLAGAAGLFALWACPPYLNAWWHTGNPFFPLANAWFQSPLFNRDGMFTIPRLMEPLSLTTLYDLTFHSSRYYEGWDGGLGLGWILLPAVLFGWRAGWTRVAIGIAAALCVLISSPNLRYLAPALAILAPVFRSYWLLPVAALNLMLLPASSSWHKDFALNWFDQAEVDAYVRESAPGRALVGLAGDGPVLVLESTEFYGIRGRVYSNSWHHWAFAAELERADSREALRAILERTGIRRIIAPAPEAIPQAGLADMAANGARRIEESGRFRIYRLVDGEWPAPERPVLDPGRYENDHPGIQYSGSWRRQGGFPEATAGSVTYSNVPGARAVVRFRGTGLRWVFTRAPNRGATRIRVDGGAWTTVECHSRAVAWQAAHTLDGLASREHQVEIEAVRAFTDIDAVEILSAGPATPPPLLPSRP